MKTVITLIVIILILWILYRIFVGGGPIPLVPTPTVQPSPTPTPSDVERMKVQEAVLDEIVQELLQTEAKWSKRVVEDPGFSKQVHVLMMFVNEKIESPVLRERVVLYLNYNAAIATVEANVAAAEEGAELTKVAELQKRLNDILTPSTPTPKIPLTNTPTPTPKVLPTNTPTQIPSNTPTPTPKVLPTNTPTLTPKVLPTNTPTRIPSSTHTHTPSPARSLNIANVSASEYAAASNDLGGNPTDYYPDNVSDNKNNTAWRAPYRNNPWLSLTLTSRSWLTEIRILGGYDKYDPYDSRVDRWKENRRPQEIRIILDNLVLAACRRKARFG